MTERKIPHVKDIFGGGKAGKFKYSDYDGKAKQKEDVETTEVVDAKLQILSHPDFDVTQKNPEYKKKSFAQLADRKLLGAHGKGPAPQAPSQYGNYEKQHDDTGIDGTGVEGILPGIQRMPPTDFNHNDRDGDSDYDEGFPNVSGNGFPDMNGFLSSMSSSSKYNPIFEDKQTRESEHNRVNRNVPAFMSIFTEPEIDNDGENVTSNEDLYKEDAYELSERDKENLTGGPVTSDDTTPVPPPRKNKMVRNKAPDKEGYEIEEEVMEFSSESDDENKAGGTNIYQQYDGDDFGQYIDSDVEEDSGIGDDGTTRRRTITQPHMKQQRPAKPVPLPPRQSSRGGIALKKKLDKSLSGAHKPKRYGSSLHNYSYADTKIGTEDVYGKKMSLMKNKGRPEDDRENTKLWWSYDMLSAQTSDNNVEVLYKSQRKNNAGELLAEIAGNNKKSNREMIVPSTSYNDNFESLRKEIQYDAPLIPKKESPLKKLTGSIRARTSQEVNIYANAAANPIYHDIHDKTGSHF
ncbi:unnamed protein product [Owenia fusiformis]|uniref:Uncharacterized protein n=1 Tax=Owenia fusiformis TaxID=6347 RepID=A0A8S4N1A5_OWEFU|nr:unnamed protein product [Owenia fusiformis]